MDFLQSSENLFMTFLAFQDFIFYKPDWQSWVPVIAQQNNQTSVMEHEDQDL